MRCEAVQTRPLGSNSERLPIANLSPPPLKIGRLLRALFWTGNPFFTIVLSKDGRILYNWAEYKYAASANHIASGTGGDYRGVLFYGFVS